MRDKQDIDLDSEEYRETVRLTVNGIVGGCLSLCTVALEASSSRITEQDPLSAERYVHLADRLSDIAVKLNALSKELDI